MTLYDKFQFIYIPVSSQSLGNPQVTSIRFLLDLTFLLTQCRLAEIEKDKGLLLPVLNGFSRLALQRAEDAVLG